MRTTLSDGRWVRICFRHEQFPDTPKLHQRRGRWDTVWVKAETTCEVQVMTPEPTREPLVLAAGVARCAVEDTFNKELARQISMRRAANLLPREDRGKVLAAYFNRRRQG